MVGVIVGNEIKLIVFEFGGSDLFIVMLLVDLDVVVSIVVIGWV